jgi:hypothetical protein
MAELSTYGMQQILTYPFKDPKWVTKLILGMVISMAGMFVPVIPQLFVMGYGYEIMHRLIVERGDLYLPEWYDWGKYLKNGWRLFAVSFVYMLPASLIGVVGFGIYIASTFGMVFASHSSKDPGASMVMMGGMAVFFLTMAITMGLMMILMVVLPPATAHAVAHDSFSAAFDFSGWWKIFKANIGGFVVAAIVYMGIAGVMGFLMQIFYMTIVLICLMFIVPMALGFYMMLVGYTLIALAYREGVDKLNPAPAAVVMEEAPKVVVNETPKPKTRRAKKVE